MEVNRSRPSVSHETRLLLFTVLIALAALWVLARLRFPERPVTANPVPPILTQLAPAPGFDNLASSLFDLQSRLAPFLVALDLPFDPSAGGISREITAAVRIGDNVAIALIEGTELTAEVAPGMTVLARDPVSGLTLLRVAAGSTPSLITWTPRRPQYPRYLVAVDATAGGVSLRPVFVGDLHAVVSPTWLASLWAMPPQTDVDAGTFLFTMEGELAGLVTRDDRGLALVPGDTLVAAAERLPKDGTWTPGWLGVEVQPLTAAIASAAGATRGVIVNWVGSQGPAAGQLAVTDIIEAMDNGPVLTPAHWLARIGRLTAGEKVVLRVRRRGEVRDVEITAHSIPARAGPRSLGLTMRRVPQAGAEVLRVAPDSAAARAGLRAGDVITVAGAYEAPTAVQVARAFAEGSDDRPVLVAITRGAVHHVLALERR